MSEPREVEIDVTPKWWKPLRPEDVSAAMQALTEVYWQWSCEGDRFAAGLAAVRGGSSLNMLNDAIVFRYCGAREEIAPLCEALVDRLSSPDVERKVLGRIALMKGDGATEDVDSRVFGKVKVTRRPEIDDVLVEWVDRGENFRKIATSPSERRLFGLAG